MTDLLPRVCQGLGAVAVLLLWVWTFLEMVRPSDGLGRELKGRR